VKTCLITQNIDNLHSQAIGENYHKERESKVIGSSDFAFTSNIYEVHGNVGYMRCSKECEGQSVRFFPTITREQYKV
jgi:NAD-dependent SIR2 family protein deacetylase